MQIVAIVERVRSFLLSRNVAIDTALSIYMLAQCGTPKLAVFCFHAVMRVGVSAHAAV